MVGLCVEAAESLMTMYTSGNCVFKALDDT
jgi:hypothetical protein